MRMFPLKTLLRRLASEERGTGIMELGIALPVLLLLLLGTVDASRMAAAKIDLEQAAQRTTDYALAVRPNGNDGTYLQAEAASAAGVPTSQVTVDIYLECDGVRVDFALTCVAGEVRARYVSVEIDDNVETMFDWAALSAVIGSTALPSSIRVQGDSIVRIQ
ncbi:MAG TPA: TadE/TadG family type IV pilus assembly protein [Sphingomonadaceae bacterium]|nr:TadE/TadG family type IV pilus assembly protein [Sphingomonadaceae bacterium]